MQAQTISTIFALLLAGGLAGVATVIIAGSEGLRAELRRAALPLAWIVALGATLGSLYFSEVAHFVPCDFCWYQRIAMYPLVVVLGMGLWRRATDVAWYALPLTAIGAALSVYHYQLQVFPGQGSACSSEAPCTFRWIEIFGFVSIPFLALGSFVLIAALLVYTLYAGRDEASA